MPEYKSGMSQEEENVLLAATDLVWRSGSTEFQLRYSDDEEPVVWIAVSQWKRKAVGNYTKSVYVAAGDLSPVKAVFALLEKVVDGGQCTHCSKPTGVTEHFDDMPLNELVCWYQYDPELITFRRSCESEENRQ